MQEYAVAAAALALAFGVLRLLAPYRAACPYCGATESRQLSPDLRRCTVCYGRYPEPG
jgi:hypothetical protein